MEGYPFVLADVVGWRGFEILEADGKVEGVKGRHDVA